MKNFTFKFLILLIAITLSSISCKKDDDNNGINVSGDGCSVSWIVNGDNQSIDDLGGCLYLDNTLNLTETLTGGGFFLQIDPITASGTYEFDTSNPDLTVVLGMTLDDGTQLGILSGSIVVSEISASKAKGTFSGTFYDIMDLNQAPDYTVTDGTFEANF